MEAEGVDLAAPEMKEPKLSSGEEPIGNFGRRRTCSFQVSPNCLTRRPRHDLLVVHVHPTAPHRAGCLESFIGKCIAENGYLSTCLICLWPCRWLADPRSSLPFLLGTLGRASSG